VSERASAEHGRDEGRTRAARRAPTTPRLDPNAKRPIGAAGIAGLQRAVGNTAVAGLLGGGGIVQRKNLEQTGWLSDLEPEQHPRTVVGDGRDVKVYKAERSTPAANKLEGFQKAAELNAHVGKTVDDKAASVWGIRGSNQKWTEKDVDELNKGSLNKIDPFFYEALVSFPKDEMTQYLGFMFQHAASYTGYVEAILDTSNPGAQGVPSMYDKGTESGKKGTEDPDKGRNLKFSNVHDLTKSSNLLTLSGSGGEEKNLDAYTKIAGEGARWQCVRKHAANLQDDSLFFTRSGNPGGGKVWGVTFRSLWLSWAADFGKKYDVADATVRTAILTNGNKLFDDAKNPRLSALGAKDYDLDNGKSHS
jgi:hypothetical protein